jgi:hypothetical protein
VQEMGHVTWHKHPSRCAKLCYQMACTGYESCDVHMRLHLRYNTTITTILWHTHRQSASPENPTAQVYSRPGHRAQAKTCQTTKTTQEVSRLPLNQAAVSNTGCESTAQHSRASQLCLGTERSGPTTTKTLHQHPAVCNTTIQQKSTTATCLQPTIITQSSTQFSQRST